MHDDCGVGAIIESMPSSLKQMFKNGDHVGVKVGDIVYDNMFPKGISYSEWLYDLGVGFPMMRPPLVTPF